MKLKTIIFSVVIVFISMTARAQVWLGSTTTNNLTYRNGNVVIGGTSMLGSFTTNERILEIQAPISSWISLRGATASPSFVLGLSGAPYNVAGLFAAGVPLTFNTGYAEHMRITTTGNIGIGTTNPGTFKLAVEGKIGAREVQVTLTNPWPDYVFEPDYDLPSLHELQLFIASHKHLPEIPSAEAMKKNGHNLGEMDALLLRKIEEMTLYIIDQDKKQDDLTTQLNDLKRIVEQQAQLLENLKADNH